MIQLGAPVLCYSGSRYAERPLFVEWDGALLEVHTILDRWRSPEGLGFRVIANDEQLFELEYDDCTHLWQVKQP